VAASAAERVDEVEASYYGPRLSALVGLLGSAFPLSFSKTQALLDQLLGPLIASQRFCNVMNTSYADPPMIHQRWAFRREIHCGAVLLSPCVRACAAT
jgi:hypothetical protein